MRRLQMVNINHTFFNQNACRFSMKIGFGIKSNMKNDE